MAWCFVVLSLGLVPCSLAKDLYVVPADGGTPRRLTPLEYACGSPTWAPDSKRIAFDTWLEVEDFRKSRLAIVSLDGGEFTLLGPGAMPDWSPDGTQLACHTYDPNQIVVLNTDGSGREAILNQWGSPRWTPDGAAIITVLTSGGLARFDLATGKQTVEVAKGEPLLQGFSIAPHGDRYCFSGRSGGLGIATRDARGRFSVAWRLRSAETRYVSWSPDGMKIVMGAKLGGNPRNRIYVFSPDSADPPQEVEGIPAEWHCASPSWSPDGKWIAFAAKASD